LRLFSFGGYGLALAALALVVFGAIEGPPLKPDRSTATQIANPGDNDFVASTKRSFNISPANQNCCGDNFD